MSKETKRTTDHETIRKWAEARDGKPAVVSREGDKTEMLRLDFPGYAEENMEEIDWNKWFDLFEENNLALIYQEETKEGERSNFNKLVNRES